jgi:predicted patatin/cPLA2 family phospholipase
MDINYFIDTILKKQEPLDVEKLNSSAIRWSVPLSDFDTGRTRYVNASDALDPFEVLRATTAMPIFFGGKIPIAGKRYIDGELGATLQNHITHALRQGAKRILILNHTSPCHYIARVVLEGYAAHVPKGMHDAVLKDLSKSVFQMDAPEAKIIIVAPQDLPANRLTRDRRKLQSTFEQGVADAIANEKELRNLFQ